MYTGLARFFLNFTGAASGTEGGGLATAELPFAAAPLRLFSLGEEVLAVSEGGGALEVSSVVLPGMPCIASTFLTLKFKEYDQLT